MREDSVAPGPSPPEVRVGRLLLIAGAPGSGKSTLWRELRSGSLPDLAARLALGDAESWTFLEARKLLARAASRRSFERLAVHYDISRPYVLWGEHDGFRGFETDPVLRSVRSAPRVSLLTLVAPREMLIDRNRRRRAEAWRALLRFAGPLPTIRRLRRVGRKLVLLDDRERYQRLMRDWERFCRAIPAQIRMVVHAGARGGFALGGEERME